MVWIVSPALRRSSLLRGSHYRLFRSVGNRSQLPVNLEAGICDIKASVNSYCKRTSTDDIY